MTEIDISIVIPAYNEAKRLPDFLDRVRLYCDRAPQRYEIIVVDDGSTDDTAAIARSYQGTLPRLSVVRIRKNRGKGYAVKRGLFKAQGDVCLFMDADGSTPPTEIGRNLHYLKEGHDVFIGSRVLRDEDQILRVKWYRKLPGLVFNWCVRTFLFPDIRDTQCGFKMFRKDVVKPLFSRSYLRRFGFDIEVLYLAHKMGYRVKEGPVSWRHVHGSKVNLLRDSLAMVINILQIRNWHCTPINPRAKHLGPDEYRYMYELEGRHWWFVSRRALAVRLIRSLGKRHPAILDAGCGTGWNLAEFGRLGEARGIDVSAKAIEFCHRRGLRNVTRCPVEAMTVEDGAMDVVTCLDVLEHVPNPHQALREIRRVLKPHGTLILMVPALRLLWSQHDEALCHLRRYDAADLREELEEAGFRLERMSHFFFTSFFIVAPIRLLRRFLIQRGTLHSDTTTLPPEPLNRLLIALFALERRVAERLGLPCGTTLFAVASPRR